MEQSSVKEIQRSDHVEAVHVELYSRAGELIKCTPFTFAEMIHSVCDIAIVPITYASTLEFPTNDQANIDV